MIVLIIKLTYNLCVFFTVSICKFNQTLYIVWNYFFKFWCNGKPPPGLGVNYKL